MALTPGLSPNIRLPGDAPEELQHEGIEIELADEGDAPNVDEKGNLLTIEHGDGSVTLTLDGSPLESANEGGPEGWFDNLVDKICRWCTRRRYVKSPSPAFARSRIAFSGERTV